MIEVMEPHGLKFITYVEKHAQMELLQAGVKFLCILMLLKHYKKRLISQVLGKGYSLINKNTKQKLEEALDNLEYISEFVRWVNINRNDERDFKRVHDCLKKHNRNYQKCVF